ncbi:MAG: hypothetical protein GY940_09370, partial [bacterium]|nr:hypothetical protein [bacterium]
IEGKSSYNAEVFYSAGGWDDAILFGGGGIDLSIRIANAGHHPAKQIYFPYAVIYHDHAVHKKHKRQKLKKQLKSRQYLRTKHPRWYDRLDQWRPYFGDKKPIPMNPNVSPVPPDIERDIFMEQFYRVLVQLNPSTEAQWIHHAAFYMENILRIGERFIALNRLDQAARWFHKITKHPNARLHNYLG